MVSQNYCNESLFVLENIMQISLFGGSVSGHLSHAVAEDHSSELSPDSRIINKTIYLKNVAKSVDAVGIYRAKNDIIIKAGSRISSVNLLPNQKGMNSADMKRQKLIDSGIVRDFVFTSDYPFTSVSLPATIILGRSANGWTVWKDSEGNPLEKYK